MPNSRRGNIGRGGGEASLPKGKRKREEKKVREKEREGEGEHSFFGAAICDQ